MCKRKKNNDAVKRCRERKRREVMEREAIFTKLKNENAQLQWGMQKLSDEVIYLKEMLFNAQIQAGQEPTIYPSPVIPSVPRNTLGFRGASVAHSNAVLEGDVARYAAEHPANTYPSPPSTSLNLPAL